MAAHFSEAAVKFLRSLKRNNDRAWFDARKQIFETELKAPMLAIVEEVNEGLAAFAPEFVRPAQKIVMRIYRDVRFSKNKDPYKTNMAAWWARQGMEKTSGAGFYFHFSPEEVVIAAGAYMPERDQLLAIRRHLLDRHAELEAVLADKKVRKVFEPFDGMKLTRPPKGFPPDHPAIGLIMQKQWGLMSTVPLATALGPGLVPAMLERYKLALPLVAVLNEAIPFSVASKPVY